jgi:hypothetical protein
VTDDKTLAETYIVHITDTTTGETRVVRMERAFNDSEALWWRASRGAEYGNAQCDCNRGAWFYGTGRTLKQPCGDGRYRVRCVDDAGTVLYEDEEDSA